MNVEQSGRNKWGLYGVSGNVWEWTSESSGLLRVPRGASWSHYSPDYLRVGYRHTPPPSRPKRGARHVLEGTGIEQVRPAELPKKKGAAHFSATPCRGPFNWWNSVSAW